MSEVRPNDAEFAEQWMKAQRAVSAYITAAIPAFHDSEDVLQKVAVIAFTKRDRFDADRSSFLTWVIGIARLEVQAWRREKGAGGLHFDDKTLTALAAAHEGVVADEVPEIQAALRECLTKVTGRARAMLDMRYQQAQRSAAIADHFKTSENVVNVTLSRARASLAECVGRTVGWEGGKR